MVLQRTIARRGPPARTLGRGQATCSDYSNQAQAHRAADTRDADGDGIYCESRPCPCLKPGGGSPRPTPNPSPQPRPQPRPVKRAQVIDARITSRSDGDTVKVRAFGARRDFYTVRLIGIDTPETRDPGTPVECGGKRATSNMLRLSSPRRPTRTEMASWTKRVARGAASRW